MRIKKKIFAMLMMLCMVLQMLPNTVLAETISGEGNTYIGPTRICPNSDLEFYFTTDNVGQDGRDAWIGGIDKIDETYLSVYSKGDTWSAVISKNGIQKAYSQSSSFSICIFSNMASTLRELNITININHIDDNFDHKCDECGEKISDHIDNNRDHYCDTCKVRVSCSGGVATCTDKAICATCGQSYGEVDPTNHVGGIESHNAKAATCTEDGYETYWECKNCGYLFSDEAGTVQITEPVKIAASGHKDDNRDHSCDVCEAEVGEHIDVDHDHKCDYGCAVAIGDHKAGEGKHTCDYCGAVMSKCSGGTATCKDKAICEICGKPYGEKDPTNHVGGTEIRDSKAATCTEDGYEGDTYCTSCDTKLLSGEPIAASGHKDDNKDHSCDVCEAEVGEHIDVDHDHKCDYGCAVAIGDHKAGEGKHTCDYCGAVMSKCSGGTATCNAQAICEICGNPYGEKDPTNHVGDTEIRDHKDATCIEDGYEGDTYCKSCNTKLSSGEPIAASGHKDDNRDHSCDVCGVEVGEHNDTDHDHKCDYGCAVAIGDHKAGEGKHTCDYCGAVMSKCSGGTATCKDKAICEICGKPYGEKDPTNHVGGTEIRDSKAATCTENGYEGDSYCKDCGVKLSSGEPIVAFGHTYKDEVTKEATTESAGIRTYTCEKCGDSYTEEIAKLPAKPEPTKPSKPENRVEPTKPSKPENRVEQSKTTEPQKQIEPPKTVNQISLIEILIAMFVNGIAVPSMQLITSIWQLILQFIKMLLTAAF
ncbi:MAG: hypothetical protein ACLSUO_06815 [Lachnospiraceae bacterium]